MQHSGQADIVDHLQRAKDLRWDVAARERSERLGVPAKLMRDEDAIKNIRDARAKAQQAAMAQQQKQMKDQQMMEMVGKGGNGNA